MTQLTTAVWKEQAEPGDDFSVQRAWCHGYDVYGEILGRAQWSEFILLLFLGTRPTEPEAALFNDLAVALANPGPRDASVHAAMSSGVSGSPAAATLMAALSAGAGQGGGGRDVRLAMTAFAERGSDLDAWRSAIDAPRSEPDSVWPTMEHEPGFEPHASHRAGLVTDALRAAAAHAPADGRVAWLSAFAHEVEETVGRPLSLAGVAAAAFLDLGLSPAAGEMLVLLLRLPGAAAHALEQADLGFKAFPFPAIALLDDPASPVAATAAEPR